MEQQQSRLPISQDIVLKCGDTRGKAEEESKRSVQPLIISKRWAQPLSNRPLLGSVFGEVSIRPDPSISVHGHGLVEVLPELITTETAYVRVVSSPLISLHGPWLGEVRGLISGSETTVIGSLVEQDRVDLINKSIPPEPVQLCISTLTGRILFAIFSIHTNLCMIKSIVGYDDHGGVLIYEYKNGDEEQFIKRRNLWLSKHIGKKTSSFVDSLVLDDSSRAMTAYAGCWIIQMDVPVESSLLPESFATDEIPGKVFETTLDLDDGFLDKPRSSLVSIRGGFINFTSVVFTNAVQSSIKFILHACQEENIQFLQHAKVQGELTLIVGNFPTGYTIFKNQVEDDVVDFLTCDPCRDDSRGFELPLTRVILALPIRSHVRVTGNLAVGHMGMVVDQYFVLDRDIVRVEWAVDQFFDATICIESNSVF